MKSTPGPAKQQRASKTAGKRSQRGSALAERSQWLSPFVIDPQSMTLLRLEPIEATDEAGGSEFDKAYLQRVRHEGLEPIHFEFRDPSTLGPIVVYTKDQIRVVGESPEVDAMRLVVDRTLASFREVQLRSNGQLDERELIHQVAESLREKADQLPVDEPSVEEGWQELLERGLKSKTALLSSKAFMSTADASKLLQVGEPAIRKRLREGKLFALKTSGDGEYRIPVWALDAKVAGQATATLLQDAKGTDEWWLYHFMTTPNGSLNGMSPFECLLSPENVPWVKRPARKELVDDLDLPVNASLLEPVRQALKSELEESAAA